MKQQHRHTVFLIVLMVSAIIMGGCGQKTDTARPVLVRTQKVQIGNTGSEAQYAGTVKGRYESNLSFQAGGRILSRNVQLGSRVHAGDVLMTVDPKDIVQNVNQSAAAVNSAKAQMSLAEANLGRYQQLYAQNAVSAAALDQYQTTYDQAVAAYQQARSGAEQQQNLLSYTNLTADADGVISAISGEAGQVVAAGQTVLTLVHSDELEIEINVPENHVQDFPIGREVGISFWALQGKTTNGTVREVAPMADASARTYKIRISIPDPPEGMQLGMTANVTYRSNNSPSSPDKAAILPLSAIYQTGNIPQVWVVGTDHVLSLKNVSVETFSDNEVKVSGLTDGDIVVTAGVHRLNEGETVRIEGDDT